MIVNAAIQEDVDLVGVSILSGAHNHLVPEILRQLAARGASDIAMFVGGIIPEHDIQGLLDAGVSKVFTPGTSMASIIEAVASILDARAAPELLAEPTAAEEGA